MQRRHFTAWLAAGLATKAFAQGAPAAPGGARQLLADMHSHYGMYGQGQPDLRREMQANGLSLVAWTIVDDAAFIRRTPQGIQQVREPGPGELWNGFQQRVQRYDAALRAWNLPKALTPADVDAALAGSPFVVMASESANFLEGQPERVRQAHAMGVRHLQLVHYIQSPLGDHQTEPPRHNGMPPLALQVIQACQQAGILLDLAHSTPAFVDAALDASTATMVWSHSYVSRRGGTFRDYGHIARSLSPEQAKKIAARGGIVGLWSLGVPGDRGYPVHSVNSYADEISRMVDLLGPKAVAFGTDMEGVGPNAVLPQYAQLREVADRLASRGMPAEVLHDVCIGNYARVLKKAMGA